MLAFDGSLNDLDYAPIHQFPLCRTKYQRAASTPMRRQGQSDGMKLLLCCVPQDILGHGFTE